MEAVRCEKYTLEIIEVKDDSIEAVCNNCGRPTHIERKIYSKAQWAGIVEYAKKQLAMRDAGKSILV